MMPPSYDMLNDCKVRIWGSESDQCSIVLEEGNYYAECGYTLGRRLLTKQNYSDIFNDMFYDYCVENGSWMGRVMMYGSRYYPDRWNPYNRHDTGQYVVYRAKDY